MSKEIAENELREACAIFKKIAYEVLDSITCNTYSIFSQSKLYVNLGTGVMTLEAEPEEFNAFCQCLCDFESATKPYSQLTKGICFRHKMHPLEYKFLKLKHSRLNLNEILEFNMNTNPSMGTICRVVKDALQESDVVQKLVNYQAKELPKQVEKPKPLSAEILAERAKKLPKPTALNIRNNTPDQSFRG